MSDPRNEMVKVPLSDGRVVELPQWMVDIVDLAAMNAVPTLGTRETAV